ALGLNGGLGGLVGVGGRAGQHQGLGRGTGLGVDLGHATAGEQLRADRQAGFVEHRGGGLAALGQDVVGKAQRRLPVGGDVADRGGASGRAGGQEEDAQGGDRDRQGQQGPAPVTLDAADHGHDHAQQAGQQAQPRDQRRQVAGQEVVGQGFVEQAGLGAHGADHDQDGRGQRDRHRAGQDRRGPAALVGRRGLGRLGLARLGAAQRHGQRRRLGDKHRRGVEGLFRRRGQGFRLRLDQGRVRKDVLGRDRLGRRDVGDRRRLGIRQRGGQGLYAHRLGRGQSGDDFRLVDRLDGSLGLRSLVLDHVFRRLDRLGG
ncbi:conserved hypothetical protein, partial [Ricinus communis]